MEEQVCSEKSQCDEWAAFWAACMHWLTLLFLLLIETLERVPALKQMVDFLGIRALCTATTHPCQAKQKPLLPPRHDDGDNKLTVVLDLDETLVCAYGSSGVPPFLHSQASRAGVKSFQLRCFAVDKEEGKSKVSNVTVYERPGLEEFLAKASEFAELVLFTAGLEGYASPLIDKIDPEKRICARLYRPATVSTKYREHVKDLSHLGRDLRRTVIIDNNPFSFVLQPRNGIPCIPFTGENADDWQLLRVLLPLLRQLSVAEDVRPILNDRFHMLAWFRNRGIPSSHGDAIPS